MKQKKEKKRWLKTLSILGLSLTAFAAGCSVNNAANNINSARSVLGYDFGLSSEPLNNLNYVRYNSVNRVLPSLVDAFIKTGPNQQLKRLISVSDFHLRLIRTSNVANKENASDFNTFYKENLMALRLNNNERGSVVTTSFYNLPAFDIVGGVGAATNNQTTTAYLFPNPLNQNTYTAITGTVNDQQNVWSNGDVISAQDLRDYLEYILDLNTGSQKFDAVARFNIAGTQRFINAQLSYVRQFGKNYSNPWGRRKYVASNNSFVSLIQDPNEKVWQSESAGDEKAVAEIKQAALNFSFYTGQLFLDYSNQLISDNLNLKENDNFDLTKQMQDFYVENDQKQLEKIVLVKNPFVNPKQEFMVTTNMATNKKELKAAIQTLSGNENQFSLYFNANSPASLSFLISTILRNLYPINRKYVETHGGILNYGSNVETFLTSGPFVIKQNDAVLGPQGYIILSKNEDYFNASDTLSNRIKIYFSNNPNIDAILFDDGYISQAYIPANRINFYWTKEMYRNLLNKQTGFGTIAYNFNLDYETNGNSYVFDSDLRNALLYVVNRADILKTAGWDFSLPTTYFTNIGQTKTPDGTNLEFFLDNQKTRAKNEKDFKLTNYDAYLGLSKNYSFESLSRKDTLYDVKTAQFYLDRFKKKHPNLSGVTLNFIDNSTEEQKKAGLYLQYTLNAAFNGYVNLNVKSLPENTYATFLQEGKYDIVYQNLDRFGGDNVQSYIQVFFAPDEINTLNQKGLGFNNNPDGSFTYANYFSDLVFEKMNESQNLTKFDVVKSVVEMVQNVIANNDNFRNSFNRAKNTQSLVALNEFKNTYLQELVNMVTTQVANDSTFKNFFSSNVVNDIVDYLYTNNLNVQKSRIAKLLNFYYITTLGVKQIATLTNDTAQRMYVTPMQWEKIIDLSYQLPNMSDIDFQDKISRFFSASFSANERKEGWLNIGQVFSLIGAFEKVIRDAAPVIPLAEVDTRWEISRVGGVSSLFQLSLQYAYDYTRPPRPGLPRAKEGM